MQKILILGFGVSGKSCAQYLLKNHFLVTALDLNWEKLSLLPEVKGLIEQGLQLKSDQGDFPLDTFSQMILSPGIHPNHPLVLKAKTTNLKIVGEIEFALQHLENRCIGITGTNGKTTTTLLVTHVLNQIGIPARALGNVGASLSSYLIEPDSKEILIIELSSFQLETMKTRALDAAFILNITPNHLDRHPSMENYVSAKMHIQNCLKENGIFYISKQVEIDYGKSLKDFKVFDLLSPEQRENRLEYLQAYSICSLFGVSDSDFYEKKKSFKKPSHRMEWVAEINGVTYYNDSKATNVDAVSYAVAQLIGPIILIVGGVDKKSSYEPWLSSFKGKVREIIAYGEAAEKIEKELQNTFVLKRATTLVEAFNIATKLSMQKDTVLFSPGCSSYDQFLNYESRGDAFKQIVRVCEKDYSLRS